MNSIEKPCRLEVFLATQAPIAVILRQGPHLWVEMIEWNTRRDTFDYGQWFKGRVDERKSDLSPDSKHFIYFATKYNKHTTDYKAGGFYAWTALSQPPRFTAVALWPHGSTYDGGGTFEDNNTLFMHYAYSPHPDHRPPSNLKIIQKPGYNLFSTDYFSLRMEKGGWQLLEKGLAHTAFVTDTRPRLWQKDHPSKKFKLMMLEKAHDFRQYGGPYSSEYTLVDEKGKQERSLEGIEWADWDQRGRLVFTQKGQLFVDDSYRFNSPRMLVDFNPDQPRPVE